MRALLPVSTVNPLQIQTLPRKAVRTNPAALDETPEAKTSEETTSTAAANDGAITLHSDVPAELLSLPQMILGKTVAFAAYLANQAPLLSTDRNKSAAAAVEDALEPKSAVTTIIVTKDRVALADNGNPLGSISVSGKASDSSRAARATASSSYRSNDDEPVYVPVPDEMLAAADQPSKFQSARQNFTNKVKDTYYRLMTMVPYSVGMFINVFA